MGIAVLGLTAAASPRVAAPGPIAQVEVGGRAPDASFVTIQGTVHRLSEFRGRPVMLWLFATWCDTCRAGTAALAEHIQQLDRAGLHAIQLRLYGNLGYPGPSVREVARTDAGPAWSSSAWTWGEASKELSFTYDPKGYVDIYFLIDRNGIIRAIGGAPNATMDQILSFVQHAR